MNECQSESKSSNEEKNNQIPQPNMKKSNNMGLTIAIGAGIGLVFGDFIFDDVGLGLAIGAGIGLVYSRIT